MGFDLLQSAMQESFKGPRLTMSVYKNDLKIPIY